MHRRLTSLESGIAAVGVVLVALIAPARGQAELREYDTPYYTIHTDLDLDGEREAAVRLTRMAEAYHDRTRDFAQG